MHPITASLPVHPSTDPAIDLAAVSVTSGDVTLLSPVTARIPSGSIALLRGANGSGKTTLLRVLAGILPPTSGTARVHGSPPQDRDPRFRRSVAAMIGLPPLAPDLTVADHVALVAATWATKRIPGSPNTSETALDELGIAHLARRFPGELSSGQTQLLGLALVLTRPSSVLLLDEPEQRLDETKIGLLSGALRARQNLGCTIVTATHSALLAEQLDGTTIALTGDRA